MNTMKPEYVRLRELLSHLSSSRETEGDFEELERLLGRWFRNLPPKVRIEVMRESLRAAGRNFTEHCPDLAWITNVIEEIETLNESEITKIFKRPEFEETGPPLGFFVSGLENGIRAVQWQGEGLDQSLLFAAAVVMLAESMPDAARAFLNPERWKANETLCKLADEWIAAGQKPDDARVRELQRLTKEINEKYRPVSEKEQWDWIGDVLKPIIRRIGPE
ncbi:MAG: hypothetical protein HN350_20245 [Phycisphaerales bacterium]|jgi:hypothetical protein|nr:hypothetical protein [Phycisphaerales bacterium]